MDDSLSVDGAPLETLSVTVPEFLLSRAKEHVENGKNTYMIDGSSGESFTFQQFQDLSRNIASAMYKRGLRKGDIVPYMLYDVAKLHLMYMGVWRANGVVRAVYPEEPSDSVLNVVNESKAKWIYCDASLVNVCEKVREKVEWPFEIIVVGRAEGYVSIYDLFEDDECPNLEVGPDDPAIILGTSGTSGRSKGACFLHKHFASGLHLLDFAIPYAKGNPNLIICKSAHISGATLPLGCFLQGETALVIPQISNESILHAITVYKPGYIYGFPNFIISLVSESMIEKYDKNCLEIIIMSGTAIDYTFLEELKRKLPNVKKIGVLYGLTECAPVSSPFVSTSVGGNFTQWKGLPIASMGKPCPGTSVQIREFQSGKLLQRNMEGEICIKSIAMFSEYIHQLEETQKAFTADGLFRTGDTGYLDENGFLFYVGRYKEMFKCSGNHVYPSQIDEVIFKHPAVENVCTIGIKDPNQDQVSENIPRAFVTLRPGHSVTAQEIINYAHERLPSYKHLKGGLLIIPELPKGASGKITRQLVAKMFGSNKQP